MSTLFWQTGMDDWLPLEQIPQLTALLNTTAATPQPAQGRPKSALRSPSEAKSAGANVSSTPATVRSSTAKKSESPSPAVAAAGRANPAVPRTQPARPAPTPSFSRQPAARASVPSAAKPPVAPASKPASVVPSKAPFAAAAPKVTRGPASLSARSSSPTLELVELEADDEIADILASQERSNGEDARRMRELERLAALAPMARSRNPGPAPDGDADAAPKPPAMAASGTGSSANSSIASEDDPNGAINAAAALGKSGAPLAVALPQRKTSRSSVIVLIALLFVACLAASYVTRQPRPLYTFLHDRGWEQSIDQTVQKISYPVSARIRKWLKL